MRLSALFFVLLFSVAGHAILAPNSKTISKLDCLDQGGRANDGADGIHLLCEGGKYDGYVIVSCDYSLDGQAYVGKDDGDLTFDDTKYRCTTITVGNSECNLCKDSSNLKGPYQLVVAFDGAENDFFVYPGLDNDAPFCHGIATEKKKK